MPRILTTLLGIFAGLAVCLVACRLQTGNIVANRRSNKNAATSFILPYGAAIERTSSYQAMVVRFKTRSPGRCELKVWAVSGAASPAKDNPLLQACVVTSSRQEFYEIVQDIDPKGVYAVEIAAWPETADIASAERLIISEQKVGDDGNDLIAMRFDAPLRSAQIHRSVVASREERGKLVEATKPTLGCHEGYAAPSRDKLNSSDQNTKISKIAARGYASGQAAAHPQDPARQLIRFQTVQAGDRWEWSFEFAGKSQVFYARQGAEFKSLEMVSTGKKNFYDPTLDVPDDPLALDIAKPLVFQWSADGITERSFVRVQIGPPGTSKPVTCWFDAAKGSGAVPADWLAKLPTGKNEVFVALETTQWQDAANVAGPPWLLATYDWRLGLVSKQ